ncbi:MAG: ABC transporter substrate-binding protein, partial [Proteobacteria bacterium]|nr:ABC transporter substrate-binding protein [Burkholderiales bacterium]
MARVSLSLACCDYDRTQALFHGTVAIEGCDVVPVALHPEQAFHRAFKYQEFDVTELSMSGYMAQVSRGGSPYVGIPVFPSRAFRHSAIYVRTDRGITAPGHLKGRLVGAPNYQMTAAVWVRGILQDEFGVRPADLRWRIGGQEEPGRTEMVPVALPEDVEVASIGPQQTLSRMLDDGALDAMISAKAPSCFERNPHVARLFPAYREVEAAYYEKTRLFPIMHLVGVRRTLVEKHPWLPVSVFNAFVEAKARCYRNQAEIGH